MEARVLKKVRSARARKGTRHWDYGADYDPTAEKKALDPKKVMDVDAEAEDFVASVLPEIENVYTQFGEGVANTFGMEWNLRDPEVAKDILTRSNRLAGTVQTTWERVQEAIVDGEAEGETIDGIAKRIGGVFTQAKGYRARVIARTEVVGAANAGALRGAAQTGVVERKVWLATVDHRTRSSHVQVDGQAVDLGKKFNVAGSSMEHPGDPAGGASEVINCRCTMLFERGDLEDEEAEVPEVVGIDGGDATPIKPRLVGGNRAGASAVGKVRKGATPKRGPRKPDGTPGDLLNEEATKGKVPTGVRVSREAVRKVHAEPPDLPEIDVFTTGGDRTLGAYKFRHSGDPVEFNLSTSGTNQAIDFTHEYGHYFDHQDFGSQGFSSERAANVGGRLTDEERGPLAAWWDAVAETDAYKRLRDMSAGKERVTHVLADGRVIERPADFNFVRYLLDPREVWARSYAQFIAKESGDEVLGTALNAMRESRGAYPFQWDDDDFEGVVEAMRAVFREQGLAE